MAEKELIPIYIGIDFGKQNSLISYFTPEMDEPETISTIMGQENYLIPTVLAKKKGLGQWFYGNDALSEARAKRAIPVNDFYEKALINEKIYLESEVFEARDLLAIYLKKLISIPGFHKSSKYAIKALSICTDKVDMTVTETFSSVISKMGLLSQNLYMIDKTEGFYYYTLSQQNDIFRKDVLLFDLNMNHLSHTILHIDISTKPRLVTLQTENDGDLIDIRKDESFDLVVTRLIIRNDISACYLVGEGFEGDWMQQSLSHLLKGRRVFMGKNLYSKGACIASIVKSGDKSWNYVYIGDNELKINVSLKVYDKNEMTFISLLNAGDNWYEAKGEAEVILDGDPSIECWVQRPESRKADVLQIGLNDFPKRENRTSRIRISAVPISDIKVKIKVTDLGFGEICPATNKVWEHEISAGKNVMNGLRGM